MTQNTINLRNAAVRLISIALSVNVIGVAPTYNLKGRIYASFPKGESNWQNDLCGHNIDNNEKVCEFCPFSIVTQRQHEIIKT